MISDYLDAEEGSEEEDLLREEMVRRASELGLSQRALKKLLASSLKSR